MAGRHLLARCILALRGSAYTPGILTAHVHVRGNTPYRGNVSVCALTLCGSLRFSVWIACDPVEELRVNCNKG
jgi:hypothetical protein